MRFSTLPPPVRALWAKSSEEGGHGLLAHMLDVAAAAEELLHREPSSSRHWAARSFGLESGEVSRWLACVIGLHDFGKAIPGFQRKWREGEQRCTSVGLTFPRPALDADVHSCATAVLLQEPLQQLTPAAAKWLRHAVRAVSAHHGLHIRADELVKGRPVFEPDEWKQAREELLIAYWQTLAPQGVPQLKKLSFPAINWLAGLTSVADWIASNSEWFPLGESCDDLQQYYESARACATRALERLGWRGTTSLVEEAYSDDTATLLARILSNYTAQPRELQKVGDTLLQGTSGPVLMLVEAAMGEGKTELAFIAHLRLQARNAHRGLYMALPTQATGNAMFSRVVSFLEKFAREPLDVQLAHGAASFNEHASTLRSIYLRGIDHDPAQSLYASSWFAQRRRPLLSPYGVGTVDQALYAVLNVKHHFVRLWGLGNRVVVLDEVHAYDTYTSDLITALLKWLKAVGSSVVLMSATLPRARRDELLRAWEIDPGVVPEVSYPRVLVADRSHVDARSFQSRSMPAIQLGGLSPDLDAIADEVCTRLTAEDGCGAVIVNTVGRAQTLYTLVRDRIAPDVRLILFHARFPMDERTAIEKQVLSLFGVDGQRPKKGLLIATQVAEQSLDIDVDFMISDLAPVDLLLQRAGRLHRHGHRSRPRAHAQARLLVAGLTKNFPDLKATQWEYVYVPYMLARTWATLRHESMLDMPQDIDRLVQCVYGETPLPDGLDQELVERIETEYWGEQNAKNQHEHRIAGYVALDADMELESAYESKPQASDEDDLLGLQNVTRLGDQSIVLIPVEVGAAGWRVGDAVFDPASVVTDGVARRLYARQLRVAHKAVCRHFSSMERPVSFREHPLLRHAAPLPLKEGVYCEEGVALRLDAELGLVFE